MLHYAYNAILSLLWHSTPTTYGAIGPLQYIVVVAHIYPPVRRQHKNANLLDDPHTFCCSDYFVIGEIRTCLEVSNDLMFL